MTGSDLIQELVGLPEAARYLGLHRATVNDMVMSGRLRGYRLGAHWFVRRHDLELFKVHYQRPKNAPSKRVSGASARHWTDEILRWLVAWETATTGELERVLDLHVGNIRKYLVLAALDGLVVRDDYGYWTMTETGRARGLALPPAGSPDPQAMSA